MLKEKKHLEGKFNGLKDLERQLTDLEEYLCLYFDMENEGDSIKGELETEIAQVNQQLEQAIEQFRLETLLNGRYDSNNAILTVHGGSGGTDAKDWAEMLFRMYSRYGEKKGFSLKVTDFQSDDEGGINSATLLIMGDNAYGYLKHEKGVHRLVRISPFDSSGKRHTSFASVDVTPQLEETVEVDIDPQDLRIDTYRSSGAGGQHVNKTDSAVRITHIPTNLVVCCQNERSQLQNKEMAMKLLGSKLLEIKEAEHKENLKEIKGDYSRITWGSQIRSYVFHPYTMVKDHRTNVETANVQGVMDGQLEGFINGALVFFASKK